MSRIKWETYKLLTDEEKEELNYRFEDKPLIYPVMAKMFFFLYLFIWIFFVTVFSFLNLAGYEPTESQIISWGSSIYALLEIGLWLSVIVAIFVMIDLVIYIINNINMRKWLDKRLYIEIIDSKQIIKRREENE